MASSPSSGPKGNLLLTLPPELRNVIYALVITTDFYELDPTISAKTFPCPRYGIFDIQRGIKAQGGTPSIARTCREIRIEALDVYYGGNTFALVGDESTQAKHTLAQANRTAAYEWTQLIGEDAKYLRKVRILLAGHSRGRTSFLANHLVSVVSDSRGKAPRVLVTPSSRKPLDPESHRAMQAQHLESVIQTYLVGTNDMGKVWRAVTERALYPALDDSDQFDFDISEEGIAKIVAKHPMKKPKTPIKRSATSKTYQSSPKKMHAGPQTEKQGYDSDCMEIPAPVERATGTCKQTEASNVSSSTRLPRRGDRDASSDVIEIEAPGKKPKARKKAQKATLGTEAVHEED